MTTDEPRDPEREQDEAAARFEKATGRNPMDPAPPAVLHWKDGKPVVYGPPGNPETADVDHFARHGIEVERRPLKELPPGQRGFLGVAGRYPAGTDPRAALNEVVGEFFRLDAEADEPFEVTYDAIDTTGTTVSGVPGPADHDDDFGVWPEHAPRFPKSCSIPEEG